MTDIVERLRAREIVTEPGEPFTMLTVRPWFTENLLLREDAADEIQRLRIESARWKENNKAGWVALGLIREALTEWCIPGTLDSEEYADGLTQQHAAEQLIAAISSLREQLDAANTESRESTEIIGELRAERGTLREALEVLDQSYADLGRKLAEAGRDAQLGQKLEAIIAMRTAFTGEPPYVGDEGVALALTQALDERDRLREGIRKARIEISGGLCYFTAEAKHLQLADADRTLAALSDTEKPND